MTNLSGLRPLGHAVLVKPYEPEISKTSLIVPPSAKERNLMVENRAIIVELGPHCWADEPGPRAVVGQKVFITKFAGNMAIGPKDGETYRLINDNDIYCGIEE